jgi:hypothetical protein
MKTKPQNARTFRTALIAALLITCNVIAQAQRRSSYENPALAGDYLDPSVIRVGRAYWAVGRPGDSRKQLRG